MGRPNLGRSKYFAVTLHPDELRAITKGAKALGMSRSAYVGYLTREPGRYDELMKVCEEAIGGWREAQTRASVAEAEVERQKKRWFLMAEKADGYFRELEKAWEQGYEFPAAQDLAPQKSKEEEPTHGDDSGHPIKPPAV